MNEFAELLRIEAKEDETITKAFNRSIDELKSKDNFFAGHYKAIWMDGNNIQIGVQKVRQSFGLPRAGYEDKGVGWRKGSKLPGQDKFL